MDSVIRLLNAAHVGRFFGKYGEERAVRDMIYAYKKCMPLVYTEMAMRQNLRDIGAMARIPNFDGGKPAWGAWLPLSITSYTIDIPDGATMYMFDAWGELKNVRQGPDLFVVHHGNAKYTDLHMLRSDTSVARIVVTAEHEEDGGGISLRFIDPLVNEYAGGTKELELRRGVEDSEPHALSGREYFALVNSLVAANPTADARIRKGLNYTEGAPATVLEAVRARALKEMHVQQMEQ